MLKKVSEGWWMLRFDAEEGRFVWFGYSEGEVKGKFAAWMRRVNNPHLLRSYPITGSRAETAHNYRR